MFDSVFTAFATTPEIPFESDRPLIPVSEIERALDAIEQASSAQQTRVLAEATANLLERAGVFLQARDVAGIQSLEWNAGVALQAPIFSVWAMGWQLGSGHMIREMIAAVPEGERQKAEGRRSNTPHPSLLTFATAQEKDAIAALLQLQPGTIVNTAAEQAVLRRVVQLSGNFSEAQLAKLKVSLIGAISPDADGKVLSRKELLDQVQANLQVGKARAEMIARTELTNAYNSSRIQTALQSSIVTHFRFLAISDQRTSKVCLSRNGLLLPVTDQAAIAANRPALHVRCVVGSTRVLPAGSIRRVANRFADTDVFVIRTASDRELTCTPNHPILTNNGWVAAEALNLGDKVVCDIRSEWEISGDRDNQDAPPRIEDIAEAFLNKPSVITVPVPTSAPDFHGDGASSQVAVISSDTGLVLDINPSLSQQLSQVKLILTDAAESLFSSLRSLDFLIPSLQTLASGKVGSSSEPLSLFKRGSVHPGLLLLTAVSKGNTSLFQSLVDGIVRATQGVSDCLHADPLLEQLDSAIGFNLNPLMGSASNLNTPPDQVVSHGGIFQAQSFAQLLQGFTRQVSVDNLLSLRLSELILEGLTGNADLIFFKASTDNIGRALKLGSNLCDRIASLVKGANRLEIQLLPSIAPVALGNLYPLLFQSFGNRPLTDSEILSNLTHCFPGGVFFDNVIHIERQRFEGHVYNLETEQGYYSANGIITSNCRSTLSPVMGTINPTHAEWVADPERQPGNRTLEPLPKGWNSERSPIKIQAAPTITAEELSRRSSLSASNPLVERGRKLGAEVDDIDKRIGRVVKLYDDADTLEGKELQAAKGAARMAEIRQAILKRSLVSADLSKTLADRVTIPKRGEGSALTKAEVANIRGAIAEFFQLTGAKGSTSLQKVAATKGQFRAFAEKENGLIDLGALRYASPSDPNAKKPLLFHEMGHHVEFENIALAKQAKRWVRSVRTGDQQALSLLTGSNAYGEGETAYPDHFVTPYVGKFYDDATEVVSVGLEHFVDGRAMFELYRRDPEHFYLILGIIL